MPPNDGGPLILVCSPRRGGNCDALAGAAHRELPKAEILPLRDFPVLPCTSCGYCASRPGGPCPREAEDESARVFSSLNRAATLLIISPIYFYHLPAQFKAVIDRSQPRWSLYDTTGGLPAKTRAAYVILIGGRKSGKRLFEGSILTLRLWLGLFGFAMADPLTLYGLDAPGDAASNPEALGAVAGYARAMSRSMAEQARS